MRFYQSAVILFFIFITVFLAHSFSPVHISYDTRWVIPAALSLAREGNLDLDEYHRLIKNGPAHAARTAGGHFYNSYPIGTSLLVAPLIWALDRGKITEEQMFGRLEVYLASLVVATAAVFIYLFSQLILNDRPASLLLSFIFAFCSPAWSTASRSLWQHGPSMLMLSSALYLILKAREKPGLAMLAGLPLAFSYLIRPTNILSLILFSIYILVSHRGYFLKYCLTVLVIILPFFIYNFSVYGFILPPYFLPGWIVGGSYFAGASLGNLISPARGLFIFCPVFLFSFAGGWLKIKSGQFKFLDTVIFGILYLHWLGISSFNPWWAGHSYGPRFFSDMVPYLIYFLIPFVSFLKEKPFSKKRFFVLIFAVAVAFSFYTNFHGATNWQGYWWHDLPRGNKNVNFRLWDWSAPQFLRF